MLNIISRFPRINRTELDSGFAFFFFFILNSLYLYQNKQPKTMQIHEGKFYSTCQCQSENAARQVLLYVDERHTLAPNGSNENFPS